MSNFLCILPERSVVVNDVISTVKVLPVNFFQRILGRHIYSTFMLSSYFFTYPVKSACWGVYFLVCAVTDKVDSTTTNAKVIDFKFFHLFVLC
jgi:hypothetical protein